MEIKRASRGEALIGKGVLCQTYWADALRVGRTPLDLGLSSCLDYTIDAETRQSGR